MALPSNTDASLALDGEEASEQPPLGIDAPVSLPDVLDTLTLAVLDGVESIAKIALDIVNKTFDVSGVILKKVHGIQWLPQSSINDEIRLLLQISNQNFDEVSSRVTHGSYGCLIPLLPAMEIIFIPKFIPTTRDLEKLQALASIFLLSTAAVSRGRNVVAALDEISGIQSVVREILSARELGHVLNCATHETMRLLSANICGVFLKEESEVVMRSCVGNLRIETAQLRMKKGQGVAGRVFETGKACRIDEYIRDATISRDYMDLARMEQARSALAAPLKIQDEIVGVLEVWRRKNSTFSDRDVRRIMALADLVAIAIHNARLNESQLRSVNQLADTNRQLKNQNDALGKSAEIQQLMLDSLLSDGGINGIARIIERYTEAEVAILNDDMESLTTTPLSPTIISVIEDIKILTLRPNDTHIERSTTIGNSWIKVQQIIVSGERIGWACIVSDKSPNELAGIALRSGAIACALSYLENRAANQTRIDLSSEILWDLLENDPKIRILATARAKNLHIDLSGPHRIIHCDLGLLEKFGYQSGWDAGAAERNRRLVIDNCSHALESNGLKLLTVRGNLLIALVQAKDKNETIISIQKINDLIYQKIPNFGLKWGVSSATTAGNNYCAAHKEASIALHAATRLGTGDIALSDDLGVLGLLLSIRHDHDISGLVGTILGEAIDYDVKHNNILSNTLRAYFDTDCSLQAAADKLDVHQKTVRYRLTQFEDLSGMDLRKHENKLMVDLALRMRVIHSDGATSGLATNPIIPDAT